MVHPQSRNEKISRLKKLLKTPSISGPCTNMNFLLQIDDHRFTSGNTKTNFLDDFDYAPHAIDVISQELIPSFNVCQDDQRLAKVYQSQLVLHLRELEEKFGNLRSTKVPTRVFKLPICFESKLQDEATQRYMINQHPNVPYLPDNLSFVAKNNAFIAQRLKDIYLTVQFMAVIVGSFCGNTVSLPVDPR